SVAKQSVGRLEVRVGWHRTWQGARGRSCKQGCQPHPAPIQPPVAKPQAEKVEVRPLFGRRSKRKHGTLLTCPINRQTRAKKLCAMTRAYAPGYPRRPFGRRLGRVFNPGACAHGYPRRALQAERLTSVCVWRLRGLLLRPWLLRLRGRGAAGP